MAELLIRVKKELPVQLLMIFFKGDGFCRTGHLTGAAETTANPDDNPVLFYERYAKGTGIYTLATTHTLLMIYFHDRHYAFLLTLKYIYYRTASEMGQCFCLKNDNF